MKRLFTILLLLLPLIGFSGSFPIRVVNGLILTQAQIDGKEVLVILDSGAPGLVLNEKYFTPDKEPGILCIGINGSFECKTHLVREWNWLGIEQKKTKALVSDLSFLERALEREIYAVVGLSVLTDYYVTIDYDLNTINLEKEISEPYQGSFTRFQYVNHLPVITGKVNGEKKVLGLDTGSEGNYLFGFESQSDETLLATATPVMVKGTDNSGDIKHRLSMDLEMADQENIYQTEFIVDLRDKGYFSHASFDGLLGQSFLSQFNIIIHPGKQRILFTPRERNTPLASAVMP